ncbi:hypothetical protein OIU76_003586 [Salix suchowensis]|nr:hypothetical protein OIU76_003586 [Salix suchowensis]
MVLFLGLLLIVPLLARPVDLSKNLTASSQSTGTNHSTTQIHPQESKYKPPSGTTAAAAGAMTSSGTTTTVSATPGSASNHQFKAAFHEVPSGPNPERRHQDLSWERSLDSLKYAAVGGVPTVFSGKGRNYSSLCAHRRQNELAVSSGLLQIAAPRLV